MDSTIVKKDTIALVPTVPDSLLRERLAKLQKSYSAKLPQSRSGLCGLLHVSQASMTKTMLERMPLFFPLYERMLAQYGLPDELKYLSIVESALNPRAFPDPVPEGSGKLCPAQVVTCIYIRTIM